MSGAVEKPAFLPADILLPNNVAFPTWSVVACDQYTSEPDYWHRVEETVGDSPSTLRLILPEVRLEDGRTEEHIAAINAAMEEYLASTLIRATEKTVLTRIPPRVAVRRGAALELPHVMMLLDDPDCAVIEALTAQTGEMEQVYDFDLMEKGGHITGYRLNEGQIADFSANLAGLADPERFARRYDAQGKPVLLFAVGDGNHSLASAKANYEEKKGTPEEKNARYALVELVNLHDESLEFEPIHRVCFGVEPEKLLRAFFAAYPTAYVGRGEGQCFRAVVGNQTTDIAIPDPTSKLTVGSVQAFLDDYLPTVEGSSVDYIHGDDVVFALCAQSNTVGFLLPPMGKEELFATVIHDGVLPRKTFSMGEAHDKRFYLEARVIR